MQFSSRISESRRLCRSHAPALPEEEEIELDECIDKQEQLQDGLWQTLNSHSGQDDSTGLPTSSSKGSSPEDSRGHC